MKSDELCILDDKVNSVFVLAILYNCFLGMIIPLSSHLSYLSYGPMFKLYFFLTGFFGLSNPLFKMFCRAVTGKSRKFLYILSLLSFVVVFWTTAMLYDFVLKFFWPSADTFLTFSRFQYQNCLKTFLAKISYFQCFQWKVKKHHPHLKW